MRRVAGGLGVGLILVSAIVVTSEAGRRDLGTGAAAQGDAAAATATQIAEEAELADLRTQVAALSTEVARLRGDEALAGRLGGSRAGFDLTYGAPAGFIGPDEVAYEVLGVGRVTVSFEENRAGRLIVVPPRPPTKPVSEPDPADWALAEARDIAERFAPEDATLGGDGPAAEGGLVVAGASAELAAALVPVQAAGCPAEDSGEFAVTFTTPTDDTVSAITLELTPGVVTVRASTATPAGTGRAIGNGGAVANSSVGGTVTVNGIRVRALRVRADAEGSVPPAADTSYLAVEVSIENLTDRALSYDMPDFVLMDEDGRELAAVCSGVEPAVTRGELAPGESLEGWISFQVPADFRPERFVYVVDNARIGFILD